MIEELEFIEQLQNIKNLILVNSNIRRKKASPERHANIHVVKYIDILIDIHNERVSQFERDMEEEHAQVYAFSSRHDKSEHKEG